MTSCHRMVPAAALAVWLVAPPIATVAVLAPTEAGAQACSTPVCQGRERFVRSGVRNGRRYGVCQSRSGLGYQSHRLRFCAPGANLNARTGMCVRANCGGGGGCPTRPLCQGRERYVSSGVRGGRPYGVCQSRSGLGYLSHRLRFCPGGWTLVASNGTCRLASCRPGGGGTGGAGRLPDLVILDWWVVRDARPGNRTNEVRAGRGYFICFWVANIGRGASGPYTVQGGGLGLTRSPSARYGGLRPRQRRRGCIAYPRTPRPGSYGLSLAVDPGNRIRESRENNNSRAERIHVLP